MENLPTYVVDWELAQAEQGLASFTAFMHGAGVKYEPHADITKVLETLRKSRPSVRFNPREMFEEMLMREGDKALSTAGDARRLFREVGPVRRWRLMTPEQVQSAREKGVKLEASGAPARRAMWGLLSIPVALGTYVVATRVLRANGVEENIAWLIALAAYFLVRQVLNRTILRAG